MSRPRRGRRASRTIEPLERRLLLAAPDVALVPGSGYFSANFTPTDIAAANWNADGRADLLAGHAGGSVHTLVGNGGGGFSIVYSTQVGFPVSQVAAGDFNDDG